MYRRRARSIIRLALASAAAVLHCALLLGSVGDRVEPIALPLWYSLRGAREAPSEVAIVAIDEETFAKLHVSMSQTFPRRYYAAILDRLAEYGVRRVIIDAVFSDLGTDAAEDKRFASSLSALPTVIGKYELLRVSAPDRSTSVQFDEVVPPLMFQSKSAAVMSLRAPLDYGMIRRFYFSPTRDEERAEIAVAMGDSSLPSPGPRDFINFYGRPGTIAISSAHAVLEDRERVLARALAGRVVLLGHVLQSKPGFQSKDSFLTPVSSTPMFGVEIHATAAANILQSSWLRRPSAEAEAIGTNLSALLLAYGAVSLSPARVWVILCGLALLWSSASYVAFLCGWYLPGATLLLIIAPLLGAAVTATHYYRLRSAHRILEEGIGVRLYH